MSLIHDLRATPRLGILVAVAAATVGIIYGYDSSNIAGALLFITDEFGLSTGQQQLVTTAVVLGEVLGAVGGGALANRIPCEIHSSGTLTDTHSLEVPTAPG